MVIMKCFLFLLLLFCSGYYCDLTVQVEPKGEDCFSINLKQQEKATVQFWVTRGGLLDIDFRIFDANRRQLYTGLHFETGSYSFVASSSGEHQICFNNEMARWTAKVVQFEVFREGKSTNFAGQALTKDTLTPVDQSLKSIAVSLDKVQEHQRFLKLRETKHRDTAESTNSRVYLYSLIESICLVLIGVCQVFFLRCFFSDNKRPV